MTAALRRNWLFGTLAVGILFLLIEVALRLFVNFSVDYLSRRQSVNFEYRLWQMHLFNNFMGMHEPDPDLFWRLKPHFRSSFIAVNSDGFAGPEIAPKSDDEFRILFLGDSTPLGLGLTNSELSFVRQLETLLRTVNPGRKISVINAAVAGYTSRQCQTQLELIGPKLQPDLVITYFGNNDPSINGYLSDNELFERTRRSGWLNHLLGHLYSYQLLKGVILGLRDAPTGEARLKPRVSIVEARENLAKISEWCEQNRAGLIVCTAATPDLWPPGIQFKIFAHGRDDEGRLVMSEEMQAKLGSEWALCLDTLLLPGRTDQWTQQVYRFSQSGLSFDSTQLVALEDQLAHDSGSARLWNNLGVVRWQLGNSSAHEFLKAVALDSLSAIAHYNLGVVLLQSDSIEARFHLKRAKELDDYSLRIKMPYNQSYREWCSERGLSLVDIDSLFRNLPENEYFVDHCHPTLAGHKLIAECLAARIEATRK